MKKTDIAMIILIASVSILAAYFIVSSIPFFKDTDTPVEVKVAEPITATFDKVDTSIFNKNAINPTVEVILGNNGGQPISSGGSSTTETKE